MASISIIADITYFSSQNCINFPIPMKAKLHFPHYYSQMQKYKIIKVLGDGAFGTVFKAVNTKTSEVVAIKKMKQKYQNWEECLQLRQIKSLRKLSHANIIQLKEVLLVSGELHLVFDYLANNVYEEYSARKKEGRRFSEKEIKNILFQIANALAHLHRNGFFHRDLKPQNLLISASHVSLCDFGLARQIRSRPPFTDYVSTRWYRAPQLLLRSTNYNSPVDVFAFGCIAAELYNLAPIFAGSSDADQLNRIVKVLGTPLADDWPEGFKLAKAAGYYFPSEEGVDLKELIPSASPQAISLISKCMRYSSRHRLSMQEIVKHQYFQDQTFQMGEVKDKQVTFEQRQKVEVFDHLKPEKQLFEEFRTTKQQFRKTRKEQAFFSDPLRNLEKAKLKAKEHTQDLDQILRELEEKKKKKNQSSIEKQSNISGLPLKVTREKFYTQTDHTHERQAKPKPKRQKTLADELLPQRYLKGSQQGSNPDEKSPKNNIFGFKFQPASLPFLAPLSHQKNKPLIFQAKKKNAYFSINNSTKQSGRSLRKAELSPLISPFNS